MAVAYLDCGHRLQEGLRHDRARQSLGCAEEAGSAERVHGVVAADVQRAIGESKAGLNEQTLSCWQRDTHTHAHGV